MLAELDSDLLVDRRNIPFTLDRGIAHRAALGLIVLATDHTIEHEWRAMLTGIDGLAF
jgi:maleate isomerase